VDDTAALLEPCFAAGGPPANAVILFLFDDEGFASAAWPGLLDELLARRMITRDAVESMKADPGSLMVRQSLLFTQHTYDMVGDRNAGDDEYRLGNEVAHKTAQLLVEARFGRQPEVLRWGLGYVAEQRLFRSIYQFNASGMVAADDHFQWPAKTAASLKAASKVKSFSLVDAIVRTPQPGTTMPGQRAAWAVLDHALAREPSALADLLAELGALHRAADPRNSALDYRGDADETRGALERAWNARTVGELCEHLKRVK
jgi:hypothetical protein